VCCSVLQCVAVYCSVLQCVAVCVAVCGNELQCVALFGSVLVVFGSFLLWLKEKESLLSKTAKHYQNTAKQVFCYG